MLVPVVRDQHGRTLDGRHRVAVAERLGVPYRVDVVGVRDDDDARRLAVALNVARRHLGREERAAAHLELKRLGMTNAQIAQQTGVSDQTVRTDLAAVSKDLETQHQLPDRVVGKDGKDYPRTKPRTTMVPAKHAREAQRAHAVLAAGAAPEGAGVVDVRQVEQEARQTRRAADTAALAEAGLAEAGRAAARARHLSVDAR